MNELTDEQLAQAGVNLSQSHYNLTLLWEVAEKALPASSPQRKAIYALAGTVQALYCQAAEEAERRGWPERRFDYVFTSRIKRQFNGNSGEDSPLLSDKG